MTSDALSTGKPTYIIPIQKIKLKIKKFHSNLLNQNVTRIYNNNLETWRYKSFKESKKVADELKKN